MKVFEILASQVYNVRIVAKDAEEAEREFKRKVLDGFYTAHMRIEDTVEVYNDVEAHFDLQMEVDDKLRRGE